MGILSRIFHPPLFQGSLKAKGYFEGWYFKQVSADLKHVYSFIPGLALERERYAFIQVIDGISGQTRFIRYPLAQFEASKREFEVRIGGSRFSAREIVLEIDEPELRVSGKLSFDGITPYPARLLSPGIMGWYSFVPRMECRHGLVSMDHGLNGSLSIDGRTIDFSRGRGYIEKDWGHSFPESWIWIQSNNFSETGTSFMLSVAKIPWLGSSFVGFLGFLKRGSETRFFATYNGAKITAISNRSRGDGVHEGVEIEISRGRERLTVTAESTMRGALKSPVKGRMESYIKESVDAVVQLEYTGSDGDSWSGSGRRGGLEIVEGIFSEF